MKLILKFPLEVLDQQTVLMPAGAEILYVEMQHSKPTLWVLCSEGDPVARTISIRGTGHPTPDHFTKTVNYIGTCIDREHNLVWHVFEGGILG